MFNHRIRILSSLLIAFIIVNFYGRLSKTPFISPLQAERIKNQLLSIKFNPNSLIELFKIKFSSDSSELNNQLKDRNNSFNLPTIPQPSPTSIVPTETQPTGIQQTSPTIGSTGQKFLSPTVARIPTTKPIATAIPQPTKKPKPTATPKASPITSDTRPGNSLMEIFKEVSKRQCVPAALLMAFQTQESGPYFNKDNSASVIKIYNTYGWWKTGKGDPCFGLGYHTQTGIVPADSVKAGQRCRNAVGSSTDQGIMGILQISQWEEETSRKNTKSTLPNNIDRRVLFDNALIFASITKNRVGNPPANCDSWPDSVIKVAAEKHYGSCGDNYCANILKYYKQYK